MMRNQQVVRVVLRAVLLAWLVFSLSISSLAQKPSPEDDDLRAVVALFRHGIRPPLQVFACSQQQYSGEAWPALTDWNAISGGAGWGNLTRHGKSLAEALGRHYATRFKGLLRPKGLGVYLWADVDERTQQTAMGLRDGFCWPLTSRVACRAQLDGLFKAGKEAARDPLFHPFSAGCGTPNHDELDAIVKKIESGRQLWMQKLQDRFRMLQEALNCNREQVPVPAGCPNQPLVSCTPLLEDWLKRDKVSDTCGPDGCSGKRDSAPIKWDGAFSYASSATEAFLLEYANQMPPNEVGWGRTDPPSAQATAKLGPMLELHEFFFDQTQRQTYLAKIQASNLVREVRDDLARAAGEQVVGCPHGTAESKFIGLVGHDTNLAGVGALLDLHWSLALQSMPANDALPAGALVFELRERRQAGKPELFVRVFYVTLSPRQMREFRAGAPAPQPSWIDVTGKNCGQPAASAHCDISLAGFESIAEQAWGKGEFLSRCEQDRQVCGKKP